MKKYLLLLILGSIFICGCEKQYYYEDNKTNEKDNTYSQKTNSNSSSNSNNGLIIIDDKSTTDINWYYVIGTLKNNSNNNYDEVVIQYIALDKDGYNLATCSDIAYNLNAGDTYSFRATCVTNKDNVASYKLNFIKPF